MSGGWETASPLLLKDVDAGRRQVPPDDFGGEQPEVVRAPAAVMIPLTGTPPDANQTIALPKGWNLIGPTAEITITQNTSLVGPAWWWDADSCQYHSLEPESDALIPGKGYWLFAKQSAELTFGR